MDIDFDQAVATVSRTADTVTKLAQAVGSLRQLLVPAGRKQAVHDGAALVETVDLVLQTQQLVLALQGEIAALAQRCRELEGENRRLTEFQAKEEDYELRALAPHSYAYARKTAGGNSEAGPYLCANCFQQANKAYLQLAKRQFGMDELVCPRCGARTHAANDLRADVITIPRERGGLDDW